MGRMPGSGSAAAIADYGFLSDCQGAALVSRDGSVDWWCPPRFDAPSVFTRLLDPDAGHWSITPFGDYTVSRRYLERTMVLQTDFRTEAGTARLTDALLLGPGERDHDIGLTSPHALVRHVEVLDGEVALDVEIAPRLEYGRVEPRATEVEGGISWIGAADRLRLSTDVHLRLDGPWALGRLQLAAGQTACFCLRHRSAGVTGSTVPPGESGTTGSVGTDASSRSDPASALADTAAAWQSWSDMHQTYDGPYREHVLRAGLLLQALTYQPTGAVIAAPTTSLPEVMGGEANWDYRFAWLRDASLTMRALWVAACPDEADRFFSWMADSMGGIAGVGEQPVPIMMGVAGEHDLSERTLRHLAGYRGSRPVRVGNTAWTQKQLDVMGEVLDSAWVLREQLTFEPSIRRFLRALADRTAMSWRDPDSGIWEGREGERHYLHSKILCWFALERAVQLADDIGASDDVARWAEVRDEIRDAVLDEGWSDEAKAFTGAFGSDHLDAAVLLLPIVGFLPPDDERVLATLDTIERELGEGPFVRRWTGGDEEGAFLTCSFWLAEARAMGGQVQRAREIVDAVLGHANDLGLLAEEVNTSDGTLLGNFPQGLSHIALVNAAWAIAQAEAKG